MIGIIIILIILSLIVILHELGHFLAAKMFGIKVEEFGFGFPPRAWGKKIGETIYSINWIPIGGFVKLFGEDQAGGGKVSTEDPTANIEGEDLKRAFFAKPVWQRAVVIIAGVVMNALLAFVIYYVFLGLSNFQTELPLLTNHSFFSVNQININSKNSNDPVINFVLPNSPAEKAGIKAPARIITIDNQSINTIEQSQAIINKNKGKTISISWAKFSIENGKVVFGKTQTGVITPRVNPGKNEGPTGVVFIPVAYLSFDTPAQKIFSGITYPINLMFYNFDVMGKLIASAIEKRDIAPVSEGISGPVGIVSIGSTINKLPSISEQIKQFLNLAGIISISLAFFNILPIPALDGGRLFFILIEGVIGKKISPKLEGMIHTAGMAILLGLMVLVTFKDILQLFK